MKKQRFFGIYAICFRWRIRCGRREQGGSTAESPAKLRIGNGWKYSQHFAR